MRPAPALILACALVTACAPAARRAPARADTPARLLSGAIAAAGGARALEAARALRWDGSATVHASGRRVGIRGTWAIQPPDSAVVATYDTTRGPATVRRLIVAGATGWLEQAGTFRPMPPQLLATERDEFYLYQVIRLVPLQAPDVVLAPASVDTLGQRGFEIRTPGRPAVFAHVDSTGRLAHLRLRIADAESGRATWQDLWLAGTVEAGGVRWPREIRITMDGAPYFDLVIERLRVEPQLVERHLAGPP
jgi:hypothetical protein